MTFSNSDAVKILPCYVEMVLWGTWVKAGGSSYEAIAVIQTRRDGNGGLDLFGIVEVVRSGHILNLF